MEQLDNINKQLSYFSLSLAAKIKEVCTLDSQEWALLTRRDEEGRLVWASPEAQQQYNKSQFGIWDLSQLIDEGWCYSRNGNFLISLDEGAGETWDLSLEDIDSGMEFLRSGVNIKSINPQTDLSPDASWRQLAAIANTFYGYGTGMGIEWAIEALIRGKRKEQTLCVEEIELETT